MLDRHILNAKLDEFLAEYRTVNDSGWATLTDSDREQLQQFGNLLLQAKFDPDVDGDVPVEIMLNDRTQYQRLHYQTLPYPTMDRENALERLYLANTNLAIAQEDLDIAVHALEYIENGGD